MLRSATSTSSLLEFAPSSQPAPSPPFWPVQEGMSPRRGRRNWWSEHAEPHTNSGTLMVSYRTQTRRSSQLVFENFPLRCWRAGSFTYPAAHGPDGRLRSSGVPSAAHADIQTEARRVNVARRGP